VELHDLGSTAATPFLSPLLHDYLISCSPTRKQKRRFSALLFSIVASPFVWNVRSVPTERSRLKQKFIVIFSFIGWTPTWQGKKTRGKPRSVSFDPALLLQSRTNFLF
jgi:hypothetical protein